LCPDRGKSTIDLGPRHRLYLITPPKIAPRKPTPWLPFSNQDTPIRTISLARSARRCQQRLQAGGLRALARRLGKYLIDYTNKDLATKGTINRTIIEQSIRSCQILTHTGGTGCIFGPEFDEHCPELRTLQEYVKLYGNRAIKFEPGSRWEYSNYGFILLGLLIEKVSAKEYYDYVREPIYVPAGMRSTAPSPRIRPSPTAAWDTRKWAVAVDGGPTLTRCRIVELRQEVVTSR